jgi:hypothetical protein
MIGALIGTALSLGSSLYGNYKASKAAKAAAAAQEKAYQQQKQNLGQQEQENQSMYNKNYYGDYLNRTDAQSAINKARDYAREYTQNVRGKSAVMGSTDEAAAIAEAENNKIMSDTLSGIAENASNYKAGVENQYTNNKSNIETQKNNLEAQHGVAQAGAFQAQANNIAQATSNVGNAIGGYMKNYYTGKMGDTSTGTTSTQNPSFQDYMDYKSATGQATI